MELRLLTKSDLDSVALVHKESFPDSALSYWGYETIQRYYSYQLSGPHISYCIGAFENSELIGYCFSGVFRDSEFGFLIKNKWFLLWQLIQHPKLLERKIVQDRIFYGLKIIKDYFKKQKGKTESKSLSPSKYGILAIAVSPKNQGTGIGKLLMNESEKYARECNYKSMRLSVHSDNLQAIEFYESIGWRKKINSGGIWTGSMEKIIG